MDILVKYAEWTSSGRTSTTFQVHMTHDQTLTERRTLRLASPHDASAILEIYAPIVRDTVISFEAVVPTVEEMADRIRETMTVVPWVVSEIEGRVMGYAYAQPHRARAAYQWSVETSVFVREGGRGLGYGSALYGGLLRVLAAQGYWRCYAGIAYPNPGSSALHVAAGFTSLGTFERVGYKFGAWHDVEWFQLDLHQHTLDPDGNTPEPPLPTWLRTSEPGGVAEYGVSLDEVEARLADAR